MPPPHHQQPLLPLPLGKQPNWQPLVDWYLQRFQDSGVRPSDVDALEQWAANATAFDATGSWRARVINGTLWVKAIRFHKHWAERANVLRMMLLALRGQKPPADFEFVYGHADNDMTPPVKMMPSRCTRPVLRLAGRDRRATPKPCTRRRQQHALPLFTNSHDAGRGGLPVPEFTWIGWKKAPPWCQQVHALDVAAAAAPWASRDRRLYFSGGLNNGHHRKELRKVFA